MLETFITATILTYRAQYKNEQLSMKLHLKILNHHYLFMKVWSCTCNTARQHQHWTYLLQFSACFSSRLQTDQENTMFASDRRQGPPSPRHSGGQTSEYHTNTGTQCFMQNQNRWNYRPHLLKIAFAQEIPPGFMCWHRLSLSLKRLSINVATVPVAENMMDLIDGYCRLEHDTDDTVIYRPNKGMCPLDTSSQ